MIEQLKQEQMELLELVAKKKAEIAGLAEGIKKYNDNAQIRLQLEDVLKQRLTEIYGLNERIGNLKDSLRQNRNELNKAYRSMRVRVAKDVSSLAGNKPLKIAASPVVEKVIDQVIEAKPDEAAPVKQEAIEVGKEVKEKQVEKIAKPAANNLYEKAASEAAAQEAFLKSQTSKFYGSI
jgi:predicted nuclease with TOPRIM domain